MVAKIHVQDKGRHDKDILLVSPVLINRMLTMSWQSKIYKYYILKHFRMTDFSIPQDGGNGAPTKFTANNGMQLTVSFVAYLLDILSFIIISFIALPFGKAIYPGSVANSLLVVWGGFAAGAVLRPLGAAIVGPLYDRIGRKRGITVGLIGSTFFTAVLGLLPTYAEVGILSPVLYIVSRLIAGIFIGALVAGGLVFTTENLPELSITLPWYGYELGYWPKNFAEDAKDIVEGNHYKIGERLSKLRERV